MAHTRLKNQQLCYWELTAVLTASFAITGKAIWNGAIFVTDDHNNITLNVYDYNNTVVPGGTRRIWPTNYPIIGADHKHVISIDPGIRVNTGITFVIAVAGGGTCSYQIAYDKG